MHDYLRAFDGFYVWEVQVLHGWVPYSSCIYVTAVHTVTWFLVLGQSVEQ